LDMCVGEERGHGVLCAVCDTAAAECAGRVCCRVARYTRHTSR
jgi:hypothetical protein